MRQKEHRWGEENSRGLRGMMRNCKDLRGCFLHFGGMARVPKQSSPGAESLRQEKNSVLLEQRERRGFWREQSLNKDEQNLNRA